VRAEDRESLSAFYNGLSLESRAFRFFSPAVNLDEIVERSLDVDYVARYGLVAISGARHEITAHALYERIDDERAEVAFAISDRLQGKGLGTILLAHLAEVAEAHGVTSLHATVLAANHRMIEVFRESGFPVALSAEEGEVAIDIPTGLSPEAITRFEQRDRIAAVAAVATCLRPRSVAVVGASRHRGSVGAEVFHNMLASGFSGPVYPVNPDADVVQSVMAYGSVVAIPEPVELAVIAVPSSAVVDVARQCAEKGVRALIVLSAGFAETGPDGAAREAELVVVCRDSGMRLIGPNCLGVINTAAESRLNATFAPHFPDPGSVAFLSQSGALGLAMIDRARELGPGISSFASIGNRADISGNDLIEYWEQDPATAVILLYLESFGNPRRFARIARRVGPRKPIVAVKSGRSTAGARATSSHTGALISASDVTVDALFRQAGVVRTDTLAELFDVASMFATQPIPSGRRVAVLTNAGGPGIMCADACEAGGLELPALSEGLRRELAGFLAAEASLANPVDMIATAPAGHYTDAIEAIAASGEVDAIIVIFIRPLSVDAAEVARAIGEAARVGASALPLLAVFMSGAAERRELSSLAGGVPSFDFPEEAARALAHAVGYGDWRARPASPAPSLPGIRADEAAAVLAMALDRGAVWLAQGEISLLLDCYGIPVARWESAEDPEAAAAAAARLERAVALKAVVPGLLHKTEAGAVRLGLEGAEATAAAARKMSDRLREQGLEPDGFIVQEMVEEGVEMLVGLVHDPLFGPVLACGAGGVQAELINDIAIRITPLLEADPREMLTGLATYPLLEGFRGGPRADIEGLEQLLFRFSALVEAHPELAEADLNPVIVSPRGVAAVDARVRIEPAQPKPPWPRYRH
jgi:acetyl coenzyme A synthetase (ADP forming)-like protein